jgi:tetratricopeptide (TPR) repeat protein
MKSYLTDKLHPALLAAVLLLFSAGAYAQGGNYSSDVDLEPIVALIDKGNFEEAIDRLHDALDVHPDNADIMSLLGFSYRKTQNYVDALTFYEWALRADPEHRGANEYLGELYLETNRLDKAVEQLRILDDLCSSCREYSKLKKMIDSYQQSASNS